MGRALSAGVLLYRLGTGGTPEVLIGHPGGPFWARKDEGAWSIPKGEYDSGEDPWEAAQREFEEELGLPVPAGSHIDLGVITQPSGKRLRVFAVNADLDISEMHSNTVTLEWPRGSGRICEFPELDRVAWLPVTAARSKLLNGQRPILDLLVAAIASKGP